MRIVIVGLAVLTLITPPLRADVDEASEAQVRRAIAKALPSVVAVSTGVALPDRGPYRSMASGVIISADGLVLSQHHVTHASDRNDPTKSHPAGHKARVVLHDGREVKAELLGTDIAHDLSMLKITDPGPFPFSPVDLKLLPKLGEVVLKLGHPLGYRKDRAALARLGRIVMCDADSFVNDCQVVGGDSGGPFFDLDGRLLGVITGSRSETQLAIVSNTLPRYRMSPGAWNNVTLANRLDDLKAGKIVTKGPTREPTTPPVLAAARWSRGQDNAKVWRAILAGQTGCVVRILDGGEVVALGTVVEPGLIVTKASLLPLSPKVRRSDGTVLEPELVGANAEHDLALLKVNAKLTPVTWSDANPLAGSFVGMVPIGDEFAASGVVAHARRTVPGEFPKTILPARSSPAQRPEAIGSTVEGRGYWIEHVEGRLAESGVKPGDVLLSIADQPIRTHEDLTAVARGRSAGEEVVVVVQRGRELIRRPMILRADPRLMNTGRGDDFPEVIEHDVPIEANESGGPLFDRKGLAVGVAIATSPTGGVAIPAEVVRMIVAKLKDGQLPWPGLRHKPTVVPAPVAPVKTTIDQLHAALKKRAEQLVSLTVEYDSVTEANVPPERLAAWGMVSVRDYHERVTIAVDGTKRYSRVTVPGSQPHWLPAEQVKPDPESPAELQRDVQARADAARQRLLRGEASRLLAIQSAEMSASMFDGKQAFVWSEQTKRFQKAPLDAVRTPAEYLGNIGLQPIALGATADQLRATAGLRLAEALSRLQQVRVRPTVESVDGAKCVVVEGTRADTVDGKERQLTEQYWFDPAVGYAPRRIETWEGDRLIRRVTAHEFSEFAPGVWLPYEVRYSAGRPRWVKDEPGSPAYTVRVRVRRAAVGAVDAKLFQP